MSANTLPSKPTGEDQRRSAVAKCCLISARMLEIADSGEPNAAKREQYQSSNRGQALLLRKSAEIADEMLTALRALVDEVDNANSAMWATTTGNSVEAARAAINKAEGR